MTKIIDGGKSQGPFLLIYNLRDQSYVLCKSQGPFWLKSHSFTPLSKYLCNLTAELIKCHLHKLYIYKLSFPAQLINSEMVEMPSVSFCLMCCFLFFAIKIGFARFIHALIFARFSLSVVACFTFCFHVSVS